MSSKTVGHWHVDEETGQLTQIWVVTVLPQAGDDEPTDDQD